MATKKKNNRVAAFFKEIGYFLSGKVFLKAFGLMTLIAVLLFILWFWIILPNYTRHGSSIQVPDAKGLKVKEAKQLFESRNLKLVVNDSIYEPDKLPDVILDQNPRAGDRVKPNRTIYLTVNTSSAPLVDLHYKKVIGQPLSQVERLFRGMNIEIGSKKYIYGKGENTVAKVFYGNRILFMEVNYAKGERPPEHPQSIPRGATVDLHLYRGEDAELKSTPTVFCMTYAQAESVINASTYNLGTVHADNSVVDTMLAYVYKQVPLPGQKASMGAGIDLWLTAEQPEECNKKDEEDDMLDDDDTGNND